jgi:ABC-type transport system involved in multi-copper enzyme maturation permease subunit
MSLLRLLRVSWLDLRHNARRPLFWILILTLGLSAWGLSTGVMQIQSGDSRVGGTKAWITSEFAAAQMLSIFVFLFYSFFIAVAAGMPLIRDDELKVTELLQATPLRVGEYVWGKFAAVLVSFLAVLALHLLSMMFFNHLVPNKQSAEIIGPFTLTAYLRPTLVFALPTVVFLTGVSFAVGAWTRRPILLFVLPVALVLVCGFFLWEWSPRWLDPRINRLLMLVDPSGFRWLNETWLKGDRGVSFYNTTPIPPENALLASRAVLVLLGLGSVVLCQWRLAATLRGTPRPARRWLPGLFRRPLAAADRPMPKAGLRLADLHMHSGRPGFLRSLWLVARTELRELRSQPGLYLFVPLIVLQTLGTSSLAVGAFDTPLLLTAGWLAVSTMDTLTLLVCLLLLFYTVESLERERTTGLASIASATPVRTAAVLFGKALANSVVGVVIVLACGLACLILLAIQGRVRLDLWPFALVWGLLLLPTFLVWTAFVSALQALTGNRYTTYGIALGALIFTGYRQFTDQMNWVGNWPLWSAVRWTDMGVFELERSALVLNRLMALGLAVFFTVLAVRLFRRRDRDSGRTMQRLTPLAVLKSAFALLPYAAVPLVVGIALYAQVYQGYEGETAKKRQKDYWRKNLATWKDAVLPALTAVEINLELEPARHWFRVQGTYELLNHRKTPLGQIPLTAGDHWEHIAWKLNGQEVQPENRSLLYVFTPSKALAPGERMQIGFSFEGTFPAGISNNGHGREEFILPSGVVLTSFTPSFVPVLGYLEQVGIDKDNRYESREYPDDFYEGLTEPMIGAGTSFTARLHITAPEAYTVNSVGTLRKKERAEGRCTWEWATDQPVRFFNVVAGRWAERRGENTAVYYHPEHAYNLDEIVEALDASRRYYSEWFYPYPWKDLKLSEFPNLASYAQGFPTNITFSEGIGFLTKSDPRADVAFLVTAHEAAHQWWGNILTPGKGPGGNILAEGMAHFSTALLFEQVKGPRGRIEFLSGIEDRYEKQRRKDSERPLVKIDGSQNGDTTVTYDKGGWVFWMLLCHLGRERALEGLKAFIAEYKDGPDFPVLQDFVRVMRRFAADKPAYDAFVKQWFFEVVVPEFKLSDARCVPDGAEHWQVTLRVENVGTGRMPAEVAAVAGDRFDEDGKPSPTYQDARTIVELASGEAKDVTIRCPFKPERVLMDPDARVLQLRRKAAVASLEN